MSEKLDEHIGKIYKCLKDEYGSINHLARITGKSRQWIHKCFKDRITNENAMNIYDKAAEAIAAVRKKKAEKSEDNTTRLARIISRLEQAA